MDFLFSTKYEDIQAIIERSTVTLLDHRTKYNLSKLNNVLNTAITMKVFERRSSTPGASREEDDDDEKEKCIINDKLVLKSLKNIVDSVLSTYFTSKLSQSPDISDLQEFYEEVFFTRDSLFNKYNIDGEFQTLLFIQNYNSKSSSGNLQNGFDILFRAFVESLFLDSRMFENVMKQLFTMVISQNHGNHSLICDILHYLYYSKPQYNFTALTRQWFEEYTTSECLQELSDDMNELDDYYYCFMGYMQLCGTISASLVETERVWFIHEFIESHLDTLIKHTWMYVFQNLAPVEGALLETIFIIIKYYHGRFMSSFADNWYSYFYGSQEITQYNLPDTMINLIYLLITKHWVVFFGFHYRYCSTVAEHKTISGGTSACHIDKNRLQQEYTNLLLQKFYALTKGPANFIKVSLKYFHSDMRKFDKQHLQNSLMCLPLLMNFFGEPLVRDYYENYVFKQAIRDNDARVIGSKPQEAIGKDTLSDSVFNTFYKLIDDKSLAENPVLSESYRTEFTKSCSELRKWIETERGVLCFNLDRNCIPPRLLQAQDEYLEKVLSESHELYALVQDANKQWQAKYDPKDVRVRKPLPGLSHGIVEIPYKLRTGSNLQLSVNLFQYLILDCFQDTDTMSFKDICSKTNLKKSDVLPGLNSFMKVNLLKQVKTNVDSLKNPIFQINLVENSLKINIELLQDGCILKMPYKPVASVSGKTRDKITGDQSNKKFKSDVSWNENLVQSKLVQLLKKYKTISRVDLYEAINKDGTSHGEINDALDKISGYYKFNENTQVYTYNT